MDITPGIRQGQQVIESYGSGMFRISGETYHHSVLVLADRTLPWDVADINNLTAEHFSGCKDVEILLLGTGKTQLFTPPTLRQALKARGIIIDAMDTGAAARTYNILLLEGRKVAAALLAV